MFCHIVPPAVHAPAHDFEVAFVLQHAVAVTVWFGVAGPQHPHGMTAVPDDLQLEQSHAPHDMPSAAHVCVPDTPPAQLHRCVEFGVQPVGWSEHAAIAMTLDTNAKNASETN